MSRPRPEPVQVIKQRRDAALAALVNRCPTSGFLASPLSGVAMS